MLVMRWSLISLLSLARIRTTNTSEDILKSQATIAAEVYAVHRSESAVS
jgi:hypothetical protein